MKTKTEVKKKSAARKHNTKRLLTKSKVSKQSDNSEWQLQEAKAMFSEVVKASQDEPQIITVHGKKKAVVISYNEYDELTSPKQSIIEFFQKSPLFGVELELPPRTPEKIRKIDL
ncbi:MAG: type II toxin-antitoxin system Phd/YefM family antitoxin [Treponema sp.]|nr:type II toxin-antitoxin system Phd/YefM family antitoxin [Treponema sp.]MCL2252394.1 type II toxin-antitoxin system Phd/YefM family antitoxin [Treponema sp.]